MLRRLRRLLGGTPPSTAPPARPERRAAAAEGATPGEGPIGRRLGVPEPDQPRGLLLYKYDACPFCRRVQRHIETLGLDVPMADTRQDPGARRALRQATGRSQVPCLFIDGVPLFESADINDWLDGYAAAVG